MKLLGRDISGAALLEELEARLRARGLTQPADASGSTAHAERVAPAVDPLRFNLRALEEHADPTRPVPLHTHRGGLTGRLLLLSKRLAQRGGRVLLASALERQRVFNGHVRDSYAQLSAEVVKLRAEVERLNALVAAGPSPAPDRRLPEAQRPSGTSRGKAASSARSPSPPRKKAAPRKTPQRPAR